MAAPALIPVLKKLAMYVVTDKKALKTVCGIVLGIIFIILMPLIAFFSIASGEIKIDTDYLQSSIVENLTSEETEMLQSIEDNMNLISAKMLESGFGEEKIKKAQVLYTLALYNLFEKEGVADDLVGCFKEEQTDEELITAINLTFGTDIPYEEFEEVMESIKPT